MELTESQKQAVSEWAAKGLGLSDIQKNILSEFGIKMTYMDVRFMVLDIGCSIKDKSTAVPKKQDAAPEPDEGADAVSPEGPGGVSVELDRVVKAGSMISGTVVFSDGVHASWAVDSFGRMVLDAGNPDYRPSEDDVRSFQMELKRLVSSRGF